VAPELSHIYGQLFASELDKRPPDAALWIERIICAVEAISYTPCNGTPITRSSQVDVMQRAV
jgi:hypothetical protein